MNQQIKRRLEEVKQDSTNQTHKNKERIQIIKEHTKYLPEAKATDKKDNLTGKAKEILDKRQDAIQNRDPVQFEELTKQFRKQKKKDRTEEILNTLDKDLDTQDLWMGIRQLKNTYKPNPYHRKQQTGEHIHRKDRAEQAAQYLGTKQWGKIRDEPEAREHRWRTDRIIHTREMCVVICCFPL